MSGIYIRSTAAIVILLFSSTCMATDQANVSPEELKRRAANAHYAEKNKTQNESDTTPASTSTSENNTPKGSI